MKLIIDIPKNAYDLLQGEGVDWLGAEHILDAVSNGTPLSESEGCVSRQAIEDAFEKAQYSRDFCKEHHIDYSISMEMVRIILHDIPPVTPAEKQEPCADAISREAVIDIIEDVCPIYGNDYRYILREKVNELPPVTPAEKVGHWINAKVGKMFPSNDYKCSECGNILNFDGVNCGRGDANFCPNCGAKMEEVRNESTDRCT